MNWHWLITMLLSTFQDWNLRLEQVYVCVGCVCVWVCGCVPWIVGMLKMLLVMCTSMYCFQLTEILSKSLCNERLQFTNILIHPKSVLFHCTKRDSKITFLCSFSTLNFFYFVKKPVISLCEIIIKHPLSIIKLDGTEFIISICFNADVIFEKV